MREVLKAIEGQRATFRADFGRFGRKVAHFRLPTGRLVEREVKTVLLVNVVDGTGREVCDHLWMQCGVQFDRLALKEGDRVQFDAESVPYVKGYQGRWQDDGECAPVVERDYKLRLPTRVRKVIGVQALDQLPLFAAA